MFVDRDTELAFLEQAWNSARSEFIVVYGRRRVGKTALLRTFCADRPHTFWVASLSSEAILRQSFTDAIWQTSHPDDASAGFVYDSWERAFQALAELGANQRHVVVVDEFSYLAGSDPSVPSVLQKVWDERLQHTNLMLILCGSHIGMMERQVLAYQAPLYGRRTGQMQLRPLPLYASAGLLPNRDPIDHSRPTRPRWHSDLLGAVRSTGLSTREYRAAHPQPGQLSLSGAAVSCYGKNSRNRATTLPSFRPSRRDEPASTKSCRLLGWSAALRHAI